MSLINNHFKTFLISLLSLTLLFSISCSNEGTTGGETENTETSEIESKDFPADLFGQYRDDKVHSKYSQEIHNTLFYQITTGGTKVIIIKGTWLKDINTGGKVGDFHIKKWTKTTKGGKTIKLEGKDSSGKEATVTYDYETKTLSGTYTDGTGATYSFNGKKIGEVPF